MRKSHELASAYNAKLTELQHADLSGDEDVALARDAFVFAFYGAQC